jgi:RND family efflux transporter MFP subunit
MKMNKRGWMLTGALLVTAALAGVWASAATWRKSEGDKPPVPLEFNRSEVVRPARVHMPTLIEFSGALVAPSTATVRAKASGTLQNLDVAEGQRVRAGQPLGRIEMADFASRQAEREAAIESARAALAQAERAHQANLGLAAQNFIASTAVDTSRSQLDAARAQLQSAQAQFATLKVTERDAVLLAPIAGIVAKRLALPGEKVSVEQNVLAIVDLARLELAGQVAAHEIALIGTGQTVQLVVEGESQPRFGKVARIAPAVEPGTRSIAVTVELANPGEKLRAGQYAVARIRLDDPELHLTVPISAVSNSAGQDQVWTIESGALVRRMVTLGRRDVAAGRVEVLSGIAPDADLLALRFDNLKEGAPARLPTVAGGAAADAASAAAPAVTSGATAASGPTAKL